MRRPGETVNIRLSPRDMQTLVHVCEKFGAPDDGYRSLARTCRIGISAMVDFLIEKGVVPEPDPYVYTAQVGKYVRRDQSAKLKGEIREMQISHAAAEVGVRDPQRPKITTPMQADEAAARRKELDERGRQIEDEMAAKDFASIASGPVQVDRSLIQARVAKRRLEHLRHVRDTGQASSVELEELAKLEQLAEEQSSV